ncbi:PAC2 family protein [Candidatus Bathyarchaeota archaeon]|nr:PAC2 family protein [Candidatus Bathyarchaeota archaeon]
MKQTFIRIISHQELNVPIFIAGFPSIGDIGRISVKLLIDYLKAELFAELYSPTLPDYVNIDKKGICHPPKFEFFASTKNPNIVVAIGDAQPASEDVPAHYEICDDIINFVIKIGCSKIITASGAPVVQPEKEIYVASTSKNLLRKCIEMGSTPYKGGRIIGAPGLLLGLAEKKGLKGVCVLGSTTSLTADREASFRIYKFIRKLLALDTQN